PAAHNNMANWWSDDEDRNVTPRQLNRLRQVAKEEASPSRFSHASTIASAHAPVVAASSRAARASAGASRAASSRVASRNRSSVPSADPRSKPRHDIIDLSHDSGDENPAANENLAAGESQANYWPAGAGPRPSPGSG
ncbi:hypothetical protein THAOC_00329, partial [Thalassiosira oceanica]